jgi:hypothetical protein
MHQIGLRDFDRAAARRDSCQSQSIGLISMLVGACYSVCHVLVPRACWHVLVLVAQGPLAAPQLLQNQLWHAVRL